MIKTVQTIVTSRVTLHGYCVHYFLCACAYALTNQATAFFCSTNTEYVHTIHNGPIASCGRALSCGYIISMSMYVATKHIDIGFTYAPMRVHNILFKYIMFFIFVLILNF
jgi:hypothetical protein